MKKWVGRVASALSLLGAVALGILIASPAAEQDEAREAATAAEKIPVLLSQGHFSDVSALTHEHEFALGVVPEACA